MIAALLAAGLTLAAKATLVLALAAALDSLILRRSASAAARHLLFASALGVLLLLPLASVLLPVWRVPLHVGAVRTGACLMLSGGDDSCDSATNHRERSFTPNQATTAPAGGRVSEDGRRTYLPIPDPYSSAVNSGRFAILDGRGADTEGPPGTRIGWPAIALTIYLAGAMLLLVRMLAQRALVRRLERSAAPVHDPEVQGELRTIGGLLGIRRHITMLRGDARVMPMTWGVLRSAVLLPASADGWSSERRRAVLLHELAHVARHDCLTQTLASLACALYWPHPGTWWAANRLREERELACDDQALSYGVGPHDYAEHLLEIAVACRVPAGTRSFAVSMAAPSRLEARLLAAIDGRRPRGAPTVGARAGLIVSALVLLLPLATIRDGAAAQRPPNDSVAITRDGPLLTSPHALPVEVAATHDPAQALSGEWHIRLAAGMEPKGSVHVMLLTPGMNTFTELLISFEGLTAEQLRGQGNALRFALARDAGTFIFTGTSAGGRASGRFTFTPSSTFADALVKRGIERPTPERLFSLARHDVTLAYLDELAAQGYATPTLAMLDRAGMSSADQGYVREMASLGYRLGTVDELLRASNNGVDPAYVRAVEALGYGRLPVSQLVTMRNHSLEPATISALNARAGRRLTVSELIRSRQGSSVEAAAPTSDASPASAPVVSLAPPALPATASAPTAATPASPASPLSAAPVVVPTSYSITTPLEGRWTISTAGSSSAQLELFWTDGTNWRRGVMMSVLRGLDAGVLGGGSGEPVAFAIEQDAGRMEFHGTATGGRASGQFHFTPNRAFPATLRSLGVRGTNDVSDHQLKNLTWGGMSAANVRELGALGYRDLSMEELTSLAIYFVTPAWARGLREAGVRELTLRALQDLRMANVTPEYAREMAGVGYKDLTARDLVELRQSGVTASLVNAVMQEGISLPSVQEISSLGRNQRRRR